MRLKFLTWDVMDTLVQLRRSVGEQYCAEAWRLGIPVEPEAVNKSFLQAFGAKKRLFPNYGLSQGLSSRQWWIDVVKQTFMLSGVHDDRVLTAVAENLYHEFCTEKNWEVLPGVAETLDQCRTLGLRMAVISNFDNRLEQVLQCCGLGHHFEFVMTSERSGVAKPDIRIFQNALHVAGIAPQVAAHIGDDYIKDYRAAREAGMQSFLLSVGRRSEEAENNVPQDHLLECPQDLLAHLK
ncbi:haloacid dehalogenase-like hydrolase domain-containing protein 3 [Ambystoma mexicanum]|uniref:haloacid dehalogenase-like hydrolase domain-containing protein 3 n=1 Tax=Ambystoma mexicanum TaxID=8296 RepID=UPI0037E7647B